MQLFFALLVLAINFIVIHSGEETKVPGVCREGYGTKYCDLLI